MIKILIAGDFCPIERIEELILDNKFEKIYNDFLPYLEGNNINIVNLECPLVNTRSPIPKVGPNLIAREECIEAIKKGHFDLLTFSNNHIMDQGEKGLLSTIKICENNNMEYIGAGRNLEDASRILFKEIQNKQFAFLNFSETEFSSAEIDRPGANPLNPIKNYYSIKTAREKADHVIVIVHGGHEGYSLPSPRMVETYRFFIDAGADIVVGHHTHCYSGHEKYKEGLIFYSLGNFIFDWKNKINTDWNYGYAVKFSFCDKELSYEIMPYKQCNEKPGLFLLDEYETIKFKNDLLIFNNLIKDNDCLVTEWEKFSQKSRNDYLLNFECINFRLYKALRYRKYLPSLLTKKKKLELLNLIRCESHRDLAIESLTSGKNK